MKFILGLLALIVLAGGGVGLWLYLNPDEQIPIIFGPEYPAELAAIEDEVGIEKNKTGYTVISARNRTDLLFMQGYHHGKEFGKQLDQLLRLFQGERAPGLPTDLKDLAELFYYLDLTPTAEACLPLYTPELQVLLSSYTQGMIKGDEQRENARTWQTRDILLLQRGYAFLMSGNFTKEWAVHRLQHAFGAARLQVCSDFPVGDFGALNEGIQFNTAITPLMGNPLLEVVRLYDFNRKLGAHTRTHPALAFVFEPMILDLNGVFTAQGLAMAGQPFLFAAKTERLTYYRQMVQANDEQFFSIPERAVEEGDGRYFENTEAPHVDAYPKPPMHSPWGRRVSAVASGKKGVDYFYYWDGYRPSADLTALYYLLEAQGVDETLSAYQYHQVPASELTLMTSGGHVVNMLSYPSDPRQPFNPNGIFTGSFTRIGRPLPPVTGLHGGSDTEWLIKNAGKIAVSNVDKELIALARFYLQGPINDKMLDTDLQEKLLDLLTIEPTPQRDYFVQLLWQLFAELLMEDYLEEAARPAVRCLPLTSKRLILQIYGHNARTADLSNTDQTSRTQLIANLLRATWQRWNKVADTELVFQMPNKKGKLKKRTFDIFVRSTDAGTSWFFVDEANRISQVAGYTLIWGKGFSYWRYTYARDGKIGKSRKKNSPGPTEKMVFIRPKI